MPKGKRARYHYNSKGDAGSTRRVACKSKKKKWVPMAIYRTPLKPEQAVLSCCEQGGRGVDITPSWQCTGGVMCGMLSTAAIAS